MKSFKQISSKENSLIKLVCALQSSSKARRENGLFVLEGLRICDDAISTAMHFDKLIVTENMLEKFPSKLGEFAKESNECYVVNDSIFKKISDTKSPQGIIAIGKIPENCSQKIDKSGRYIALENLSDPSNLGAVSRTAEALGVSGIIISDNSCDPYSPKVLRASMGTIIRMPIIILSDFSNNISSLGLKVYSCVVESTAEKVTNCEFAGGSVLVIGNEANGITDETRQNSDKLITIPMRGKAESLNAAIAASIVMWEMMK